MENKNWETPNKREIKANPDYAMRAYGGGEAIHIHT